MGAEPADAPEEELRDVGARGQGLLGAERDGAGPVDDARGAQPERRPDVPGRPLALHQQVSEP